MLKDIRRIKINVSSSYQVLVGENLLPEAGQLIEQYKSPGKILLLSDINVAPLYADILTESLLKSGNEVLKYVVPSGEKAKSFANLESILEFMAAAAFNRSDLVVALGGGVVGDLAGFVAAIYNRGLDYVQIPTTFLAAIDSSVGGKTGINLKAGKNLVGAFKQPLLVICDLKTFATLSEEIFSDGIAEAIKYAMLKDEKLFWQLATKKLTKNALELSEVVCRCVELKRQYIAGDEFDTGARQFLNFGHTLGHAIEKASEFKISHGKAVAIGMVLITKAAWRKGYCEMTVVEDLQKALLVNDLPIAIDFVNQDLYKHVAIDKKVADGEITLVLPNKIGKCQLEKVGLEDLEKFLC